MQTAIDTTTADVVEILDAIREGRLDLDTPEGNIARIRLSAADLCPEDAEHSALITDAPF